MSKKVGFSASRCIQDLLTGAVAFDDVVMITAGTQAEDIHRWELVITHYHAMGEFSGTVEAAVKMGARLWNAGLIHQPRTFGAYRPASPHAWMDLVHTSEARASNPTLKEAWQQAQLLDGLIAGSVLDDNMAPKET